MTAESQPTQQPASAKPALSTAERYALMNAEVKALSEAFVAEINAANTAFQAQMQGASTDAERLEMLRTFNTEMAEMRTEVEQKTQAIRDKYKE